MLHKNLKADPGYEDLLEFDGVFQYLDTLTPFKRDLVTLTLRLTNIIRTPETPPWGSDLRAPHDQLRQ